jgi:DNA-binding IclR family transcriptional regulator
MDMSGPIASPPTQRVIGVLELLASDEDAAHTVSTVSKRLGLNRATCAAILTTLAAAGWADRLTNGQYLLGAEMAPVADAVLDRLPVLRHARHELASLVDDLGYPCTLTRADRAHLTVVARHGDRGRLPPGVTVGSRFPLEPPYGAVIMAWRPEAERNAWLAAAPGGPSEAEHLRQFIDTIEDRGYGVWRLDESNRTVFEAMLCLVSTLGAQSQRPDVRKQVTRVLGALGHHGYTAGELDASTLAVTYVVAPVFDREGIPRYEIELAVLDPAVTHERLEHIGDRLLVAARRLTDAGKAGAAWRQPPGYAR